jgi:hypothetical protein
MSENNVRVTVRPSVAVRVNKGISLLKSLGDVDMSLVVQGAVPAYNATTGLFEVIPVANLAQAFNQANSAFAAANTANSRAVGAFACANAAYKQIQHSHKLILPTLLQFPCLTRHMQMLCQTPSLEMEHILEIIYFQEPIPIGLEF